MPDPSSTARTLGQNIRRARMAAGLTQLALAQALGYKSKGAAAQVCKLENGHQEPGLRKIRSLATALEIKMTDLLSARDYTSPIRRERETRGMTQLALAHAIGCVGADAGAYISRVESGQHQPRLSTLQRMADALDIPVDVLLLGAEKQKNGKGKK